MSALAVVTFCLLYFYQLSQFHMFSFIMLSSVVTLPYGHIYFAFFSFHITVCSHLFCYVQLSHNCMFTFILLCSIVTLPYVHIHFAVFNFHIYRTFTFILLCSVVTLLHVHIHFALFSCRDTVCSHFSCYQANEIALMFHRMVSVISANTTEVLSSNYYCCIMLPVFAAVLGFGKKIYWNPQDQLLLVALTRLLPLTTSQSCGCYLVGKL